MHCAVAAILALSRPIHGLSSSRHPVLTVSRLDEDGGTAGGPTPSCQTRPDRLDSEAAPSMLRARTPRPPRFSAGAEKRNAFADGTCNASFDSSTCSASIGRLVALALRQPEPATPCRRGLSAWLVLSALTLSFLSPTTPSHDMPQVRLAFEGAHVRNVLDALLLHLPPVHVVFTKSS